MNTPLSDTLGLSSPDGRLGQLLSVQAHGTLLGLVMRLSMVQTWRNVSGAPMAARFGFALGCDQSLLGLQVERAGQTESPSRIEREGRHRCSVSLGILGTGEQLTVRWQIGQLLNLQGGSLRIQLPAALAPRAPRPLKLGFDIFDPVARGTVSSPSHDLHRVRHGNGVTLTLRPQAQLDKDLVLTVHGLRDMGFALAGPNLAEPGTCTVLVSSAAQLQQADEAPQALRMKLLLDDGPSMPADRLSQIRAALDHQLGQLQACDELSYSRCGAQGLHELPRLQICTEAYLRRARALVRHPRPVLESEQAAPALLATLAIPDENEEIVSHASVALITASPIWAIEPLLHALRAAHHTLYVMAVGAEAANSLWRELAEASGGACDVLLPGQHVEPNLARLIARLRSQFEIHTDLTVQGAQLLQLTERPTRLNEADTLHLWARVRPEHGQDDLTGCPELQATLHWQRADGLGQPSTLTPLPVLWDEHGDVARLCATRDAQRMADPVERQSWIEQHGLLWPDASRLAERAAPSKSTRKPAGVTPGQTAKKAPSHNPATAPTLITGPAVLPAVSPVPLQALPVRQPAVPRSNAAQPITLSDWLQHPGTPANPVTGLVAAFNRQAGAYGQFRAALSSTLKQVSTRHLDPLVMQHTRLAGNPARVWAMVLYWLHIEHGQPMDTHALHLVEQELAHVPLSVRGQIHAALGAAAQAAVSRQVA